MCGAEGRRAEGRGGRKRVGRAERVGREEAKGGVEVENRGHREAGQRQRHIDSRGWFRTEAETVEGVGR